MEQPSEVTPIDRFKQAVYKHDAVALRRVLADSEEARAAINQPLFGFDSPALVAIAGDDDLAMVDTLLEFGADPNRRSDWWAGGFHPLHAALGPVADRLLSAGAVPDACAAARLDRPDLLARLLSDDPGRVHERGGDGQTPLHFAASRRIVDLLIDAGAALDARDIDHRATAAEWMTGDINDVRKSRIDLARYLVERGASCDIFLAAALGLTDRVQQMLTADPSLLTLRTGQGDYGEKPPSSFHIYLWTLGSNLSPLQVAAERGHAATVEVMKQFATPVERLLLACHRGDADEARAIYRDNPGLMERLEPAEQRALSDEAWGANAPAVELLLEFGFDPGVASVSGPTGGNALHCAAWEGSVECVEAILRYPTGRALINSRETTYNGTPLSWCCHGSRNCGNPRAQHAVVARLLLAAGAATDPDMLQWGCSDDMQSAIADALGSA